MYDSSAARYFRLMCTTTSILRALMDVGLLDQFLSLYLENLQFY